MAAVLDRIGGVLGVESFEAGMAGEDKLITWLASFGPVALVGVEGTGSYGAGLARRLRAAEIDVVEVDRQNRQARRRHGKTDPLDAVEAARTAQGGRALGRAKSRDGKVEAIRGLLVARRSANSGRGKALNQIISGSLPPMSCENACRECQRSCSGDQQQRYGPGPVQTR